jgi:hypothetical protein
VVDLVDTDKLLVLLEERLLLVSEGVNVQLIVYVPTRSALDAITSMSLAENANVPATPLLTVVPEMNELMVVSYTIDDVAGNVIDVGRLSTVMELVIDSDS